MVLYLVRHTTPDVPKGVCYGQTDVTLASTFELEAELVRARLNGLHFDRVFTSPLSRCSRLAEFCGFDDAIPDPLLMEMDFGEWEMKRYTEITDSRLEDYFRDWQHVEATGGESFMQHNNRIRDFINSRLAEGNRSVLAFTHGGSILHAMILTGLITTESPFDHVPQFGSLTRLCVDHPL